MTAQNSNQAGAQGLYLVAAIVGLVVPGALVGALAAGALWALSQAPLARRLMLAVCALVLAALLRTLDVAWLPLLTFDALTHTAAGVTEAQLLRSAETELLLGPALLLCLAGAQELRLRTALGQVRSEREVAVKRSKAMSLGWKDGQAPAAADGAGHEHPPGKIRLGLDESRRFFDVTVAEVGQHISVPGASGSGKTTTLIRLADGGLVNGYSAVFIDCKGVGLAGDVRALAERHGVPLHIVDPDNSKSVGYDPCTGDAAHVANKLVGAFNFSGEAEIYQQVAMEVMPVIVRALIASKQKVTLNNIYDALAKGGLARLGRTPGAEKYQDTLQQLETSGGIGAAGYAGLQRRMGALIQGKFGPLFTKRPALNWDKVTASQSVTYFSLSATAASEDVELFGRVITQDLKQLCDARLRAVDQGKDVEPMLVIYDEFAALREARQVVDLLLQARQARMSIVIASQFLPEEIPIRTPFLQSGVLICHRVGADDAESLAAEFGTHQVPKPTYQIDYESGQSEKGSIRMVDEFNVHPNTLRELGVGMAAVYARRTNRRSVVHIFRS